jgi:preprotein translocase subunit SecB
MPEKDNSSTDQPDTNRPDTDNPGSDNPDTNRRSRIEAKKVYLKDASFESPSSPQIFARGEIQPELDVQMTMTHQKIEQDQSYYEVVLTTTVTAKHGQSAMFLAEIQQAGIFEITYVKEDDIELVLETACPHILLPFARESLASLVSRGGFPQLLISPVNFQALYNQKKAREARSVQPPEPAQIN